ncbi:MAG TPA: PQQ-dependent sugar dehydrogenase [Chitinophagaceae bacterium]
MKHLWSLIVSVFIFVLSNGQACPGTGLINFQRWNNISGSAVSNLISNVNYPNNPSSTGTLALFETPANLGNNIGIRINGYICPPSSGSYIFWIASDASGELWLSTTSNPANKVRIAFNTSATKYRQWNKYASQKSGSINLIAGQVYYVEALMKESTGSDNLSVGWARPGQPVNAPSEVIPGSSLMRQLPDTQAPTAPTNLAATNISASSLTLTWTASTDNVGVTGYDIYQNGLKINPSNVTSTSFNVSGLTASTSYDYFVKAKDAAGNQSAASATINVITNAADTEPPTSPANLAATIVALTSFKLDWAPSTDNVGVAGYDVYQNGIKINPSTITTTSYNVTGLLPATLYTYTVKANDAAGNQSSFSDPLNVTTLVQGNANETFTMRTVIANQRMPHDLVYGPDGNIWYTERFAGRVNFVDPVTGIRRTVLTLGSQMVRVGGQDGLMGLALHPEFLTGKPYVYISYTYQSTSSTVRKTRIARYTYNFVTQNLESAVTILENIPGSNDHNSARITIGPDLKLYYSVGDMGAGQFDNISRPNNAQNINIYEGKILRLNTEPDGLGSWMPTDNPFGNAVYSLGHRNPQGLVWGNVNGVNILYSDEHGPFSDDEINIIEQGRNFGWPNVIGWCDGNYNGRTTGGFTIANEQANCLTLNAKEPLRSLFPVSNPPSGGDNMLWPSVGPSGSDFYGSLAIPGWENSLLIANLKKGTVSRYKLSSDGLSIISDTMHYFRGLGRFRDVVVSPDGLKIYVACDSSGSTSGPTGGVTTTPANPGSILEFTYQAPAGTRAYNQLLTESKIQNDTRNKNIDVYPNPATNYFIVYNYDLSNNMISLYDISGKLMMSRQTKDLATRVDVNDLPNGVYVLTIKGTDGKISRTEKMVIAR